LYATVLANYQGAIMVPTEILAEQHYQSLTNLFDGVLRVELLTGSIKGQARKERLAAIEEGLVDIVVGTHALIQDEVIFSKLGLVVVDEQHRFGVRQRRILREKDRKSTRLNSSHVSISYAVFCLKKKRNNNKY